jgi:uncharacterized protein (TIGR03435 family)
LFCLDHFDGVTGAELPRITARKALLAAALGVPVAIGVLHAQPTPRLSFDVASVKPNLDAQRERDGSGVVRPGPDGLTAKRATLKHLVMWAYDIPAYRVSGGPAWLESQWYAVQAKSEHPASKEQLMQMLQSLLADRFHLQVHRETRDLPVTVLAIDKSGSKLKQVPPGDQVHGQLLFSMVGQRMFLTGNKAPMSELAIWLTSMLGDLNRPVIDRTGLTGAYDFKLDWLPEDGFVPAALTPALREQLGLRLDASKSPFDVVAIDRAEKPSGN